MALIKIKTAEGGERISKEATTDLVISFLVPVLNILILTGIGDAESANAIQQAALNLVGSSYEGLMALNAGLIVLRQSLKGFWERKRLASETVLPTNELRGEPSTTSVHPDPHPRR